MTTSVLHEFSRQGTIQYGYIDASPSTTWNSWEQRGRPVSLTPEPRRQRPR